MRRMVEKMMNCYGQDIVVVQGDERKSVRGFFQSATGKVERLAMPEMGALGRESRERFIYIGPVEPEIEQGNLVEVEGRSYHVRSATCIWGDGQPVYCWAMCVEMGGEDLWGLSG